MRLHENIHSIVLLFCLLALLSSCSFVLKKLEVGKALGLMVTLASCKKLTGSGEGLAPYGNTSYLQEINWKWGRPCALW